MKPEIELKYRLEEIDKLHKEFDEVNAYIKKLEQCLKDLPYPFNRHQSIGAWVDWQTKHEKLLNKIRGER